MVINQKLAIEEMGKAIERCRIDSQQALKSLQFASELLRLRRVIRNDYISKSRVFHKLLKE